MSNCHIDGSSNSTDMIVVREHVCNPRLINSTARRHHAHFIPRNSAPGTSRSIKNPWIWNCEDHGVESEEDQCRVANRGSLMFEASCRIGSRRVRCHLSCADWRWWRRGNCGTSCENYEQVKYIRVHIIVCTYVVFRSTDLHALRVSTSTSIRNMSIRKRKVKYVYSYEHAAKDEVRRQWKNRTTRFEKRGLVLEW